MNVVDVSKCARCIHRLDTEIFELCTAGASSYSIGGREDFHIVSHMRQGACGSSAALFKINPGILADA